MAQRFFWNNSSFYTIFFIAKPCFFTEQLQLKSKHKSAEILSDATLSKQASNAMSNVLLIISWFFNYRLALAIPPDQNGFSQCSMYAVNYTEMLANNVVKSDPSWPTQSCRHGWEYNFTEIPYSTIATEVCFEFNPANRNYSWSETFNSSIGSATMLSCRRFRNRFSSAAPLSVDYCLAGSPIATEEFRPWQDAIWLVL